MVEFYSPARGLGAHLFPPLEVLKTTTKERGIPGTRT